MFVDYEFSLFDTFSKGLITKQQIAKFKICSKIFVMYYQIRLNQAH